jgi:hypothetical protein
MTMLRYGSILGIVKKRDGGVVIRWRESERIEYQDGLMVHGFSTAAGLVFHMYTWPNFDRRVL